jgi:uncharacterized repeat protein (TIGR03837 family)
MEMGKGAGMGSGCILPWCAASIMARMVSPWDLFCHVIDNHGDVGVCWRLAADLAARGQPVRLWLDDADALGWMAPDRALCHPGVEVLDWSAADRPPEPGPVVIEAFGCNPPAAFVARMAARHPAPLWMNLEYLSAEVQAERNHRLTSPQLSGPGAGLHKVFYYPGFTPATGGLLREPGLLTRRDGFDAAAWLAARGWAARPGERVVSLFCYPGAPVEWLLAQLAAAPTLLLATPGPATAQVQRALGPGLRRGALRAITLPWLSQPDYDHLLWACDLNLVRGEDSAVRAQWAARPFVWQFYPQSDGADQVKAEAFLARFLATGSPSTDLAAALRQLWRGWNGWAALPAAALPARAPWATQCHAWCEALAAQPDLVSQLQDFVRGRLPEAG